jgi:hypothetical protein
MVLYPKKRCIVRVSCLQNRHAEQTTLRDEQPREDIPYHKERPAGSDKAQSVNQRTFSLGKPPVPSHVTSVYWTHKRERAIGPHVLSPIA